MTCRSAGAIVMAFSLVSCAPAPELVDPMPDKQLIVTAEMFIDAFYSFEPDALRASLSTAEGSAPSILFYQGWAEGGNYEVIERSPCNIENKWTVNCSITVKDDLIEALGIDFNVTDTFHLTFSEGRIVAVTNSSNDPQAYFDAHKWVQENRPELIAEPCKGFFDGGPTPGDCVRAMVRGYSEFVVLQAANTENATVENLAGLKNNTVVLTDQPLDIDATPIDFVTDGKPVVLGEETQICVVLRGDLPHASIYELQAEYNRLLGGAELIIVALTNSGETIEFSKPWRGWSKDGVILRHDEVTACGRIPCASCQPLIGATIDTISISSSKPLAVQGAYWRSRRSSR